MTIITSGVVIISNFAFFILIFYGDTKMHARNGCLDSETSASERDVIGMSNKKYFDTVMSLKPSRTKE